MLESKVKTVRNDMKTLMREAQELFREAAMSTGDKADELRARGMSLLDAAALKAQDLQSVARDTGNEVAETADKFVNQNPWTAVAISATVGVLLGRLIGRK